MFKKTLSCIVVNMIIAHSCVATPYPSVQPESNIELGSNSRPNSILKQYKDSESNFEFLLLSIFKFISQECNNNQGTLSPLLKHSFKPMLETFIENHSMKVPEIRIPQIPDFYYTFSDETAYLKIKLGDVYLRHLDLSINKLEYDVCKLFSEIDITLPKLEIAASYDLDGQIDNFPITGNGDFILKGNSVNYYKKSYINNCKSNIFSEENCDLANMNVTTDIRVPQVEVSVSGVEYRDLCDYEVNEELNNFISEYLKSDKTELKLRVMDMIYNYMMDVRDMMILDPFKMLLKMKEFLKKVSSLI